MSNGEEGTPSSIRHVGWFVMNGGVGMVYCTGLGDFGDPRNVASRRVGTFFATCVSGPRAGVISIMVSECSPGVFFTRESK